jgi:predicted Zn-dependent protease
LLTDFDAFIRTDEFLQQLNGMAYGPSRQTGIVRGSRFYHSKLGIALVLPAGWRQNPVPRGVQFMSQTGDAVFELSTTRIKRDMTPETLVKEGLGYKIREGRSLTIDGMPGYIGIADRAQSRFGVRPVRLVVAVDRRRGIAYVGQGSGQFDLKKIASDSEFIRIGFSLAKMRQPDFGKARPLKVQIVRAEADTTIAGLAQASDLPRYAEDQLRVINGLYPRGEPEPGQLIKIID